MSALYKLRLYIYAFVSFDALEGSYCIYLCVLGAKYIEDPS